MPASPDDGSGPLDVDAAFAEIVARWDEDLRAEDGPGEPSTVDETDAGAEAGGARAVRPVTPLPPPPHEDVPVSRPEEQARPGQRERFEPPVPARARDDEPAELAALGSDDRFVPEEPKPLPRDLLGWAAWIVVIGAPLFLLVVALGWHHVPQLLTVITAAVFVAGFATLVVRLPSSHDDDDDDGAVV